MGTWWMLMLISVLTITNTQSASISATETFVVAKTDGEVSTMLSPSDAATEEPNAPIKLTEMRVRSEVTMRYAHTAVVTHVRNPASKAQEATFHVLLPNTAFISGFVMTLGGKSYKAYIKEKNEAKKVFNDAVSHGTGAAHIAAKARDSNHFTVSVNVEPNSVAIFNLTYEEMLVRRNGVYNHAINLHPGSLVPKLEVVVHIKESQKITTLRVPEVRTGNEIDATENDAQNSKAVQSKNGDKEATITFTPDLHEQMRLIMIYKAKTKDSAAHRFHSEVEQQEQHGLLGQFVVQYDVERSNDGEILVNDGYFVHFLAPNTLPTLNKHVVFVLDTSSSMRGSKLEQLKTAMDAILSNLNPHDYFSIVEFSSDFLVHHLKEAAEPERSLFNQELASPAIASPENIAKAKIIISRLWAHGATNIGSALNMAIDLIHKFADDNKAAKNITKTKSMDTIADIAVARSNDVGNKLIINNLEPIIIFLTDGEPTSGETSTSRIISQISEKNSGEFKASLYGLAFGENADRNFLRKLSLRNEGFMRHIYEAADAALQLRDFYREVSSPLLAHVKFTYPKEQITEGTVSKNHFRMAYTGSEIVVAGKLAAQTSELAPIISAFRGAEDGTWIPYEVRPIVSVSREKDDFFPLERLWAYLSIKQLLDERDAAEQSAADESEKKALALALKYSFVTSLTSLVVVKPNETNAVVAEPADKNDPQQNNYGVHKFVPGNFYPPGRVRYPIFGAGDYNYNYNIENFYQPGRVQYSTFGAGDHYPNMGYFYQPGRVRNPIFGGAGDHYPNMENFYQPGRVRYSTFGAGDHYPNMDIVAFTRRPLSPFRNNYNQLYIRPIKVTTTPLSVTTEVPDDKKYHLENYRWALDLLNKSADALTFWENKTQIVLELSKDINAPVSTGPEEACSNSTVSAPGPATCVYITRCAGATNISVDDYRKSYCRVDNKYAGVCCPRSQIDVAGT